MDSKIDSTTGVLGSETASAKLAVGVVFGVAVAVGCGSSGSRPIVVPSGAAAVDRLKRLSTACSVGEREYSIKSPPPVVLISFLFLANLIFSFLL